MSEVLSKFVRPEQDIVSKKRLTLTVALETLVDFSIFLIQPLPPLLREWVLVSVAGVMPGQHVNGRVQRREAGLTGHLRESPVVTHEVDHFLLEILSEVLHAVGALGEAGGGDHVIAYAGGVRLVFVGEAPVGGEDVIFGLFGDGDLGRGDGREEDGGRRGGGGGLEELATSGLFALDMTREAKNGVKNKYPN